MALKQSTLGCRAGGALAGLLLAGLMGCASDSHTVHTANTDANDTYFGYTNQTQEMMDLRQVAAESWRASAGAASAPYAGQNSTEPTPRAY